MLKNTSVFNPLLVFLFLLIAQLALAAPPINTLEKSGVFSYDHSGIAIRGYDPVAYFTEARPVAGSAQYTYEWQGATWQFTNQQHLELFKADPEKYAPQYGGYCAYGVAKGNLVKIEPDNWRIVDDKLYLNYDSGVQKKWEKDIPGFIELANKQFSDLLAK